MKTVQLLPDQAITLGGERPSPELVEIIQRLVLTVNRLEARLNNTPEPSGGAVVDAQARAAINAIRGF